MVDAPIPDNEAQRLAALRSYGLLDSLPEPEYDAITRIAAQVCGVPTSLISLVDEDRCWFKSNHGLPGHSEAPREVAFAAHAIVDPSQPLIVEDAFEDERFADSPLVRSASPMRFYAGTPLVDHDGHALGTLCIIDNKPRQLDEAQLDTLRALATQVSSLIQLRKELATQRALQEELEQVNEDLKAFNYSVAHDLGKPLTMAAGFATIIEEDYGQLLDDNGREAIRRLRSVTGRAQNLVDDLLDLSRARTHSITREPVDLSAMARTVFAELGVPANTEVVVAAGLVVDCDARLAKLAVCNLLDNALKYSARGERPRVEVGPSERGLYVRDNGVGFDASSEAAESLFEPFRRLHQDGTYAGTGIGLAIVQRVARRHGGHVTAESQPGEGATFTIDFGG